jgi:arginine:ornithine antiporter/lysine permease
MWRAFFNRDSPALAWRPVEDQKEGFGIVSYWVLIKSTPGAFIPAFGNGNTPIAIAISSVGIWTFHWMLLRGIPQATLINAILTVVKILPIFVFIGILSAYASAETFTANLAESAGGLAPQVKGTMLITAFVFPGIEGASVYSRYARKRPDVGAATVLGFAFVLLLLVLVHWRVHHRVRPAFIGLLTACRLSAAFQTF